MTVTILLFLETLELLECVLRMEVTEAFAEQIVGQEAINCPVALRDGEVTSEDGDLKLSLGIISQDGSFGGHAIGQAPEMLVQGEALEEGP